MQNRRLITFLCSLNIAILAMAGYLWHLYKNEKENKESEVVTKYITNTVKRVVIKNPDIPTNLFSLFRRWQDLEATEYPKYISNLRAFGCPESIIRDIIITDVARLYKSKVEAILAANPPKYWKKGYDRSVMEQIDRLELEKKALVKGLLGVDYDAEVEKLVSKEITEPDLYLDFLSLEKQKQVKQIIEDYKSKNIAFIQRCKGIYTHKDEQELKQIEEDKNKALAAILSPDELNEFNIRNSDKAKELRDSFGRLDITEFDFRQIYQASIAFDEKINNLKNDSDKEGAFHEYEEQLKRILGDERYKKYEMLQSVDYEYLMSFKERFNIPEETVQKVYDYKQALKTELNGIATDESLNYQQRSNIVVALMMETEKTLRNLMGDDVYDAYVQYDVDYIDMFERLLAAPELKEQPQEQTTNLPPALPFIPPPPPPMPLHPLPPGIK